MKRVVITGVGLVTPLGVSATETWSNFANGKSAVSVLNSQEYDTMPCRIASKINFDHFQEYVLTNNIINKSDFKTLSLSNIYGLTAAHEAFNDANWKPSSDDESYRTGCTIATGISGITEIADAALALANSSKGYKSISPYFVTKILPNLSSGLISIRHKIKGPSTTPTTACAAGLHAICDAYNFLKLGVVDVMICGATEACIHPISIAGFCRMRALATKYNNEPESASRPFDKDRDGFVMGEGAGCLVLESLDHALERNAKIYGEILSVASTSDAKHITNPSTDGDGAYRCMKNALRNARVQPSDLAYINTHATSTQVGDLAEINAIKRIFKDYNGNSADVYVSSFKGQLGHLLGAAGAVETILTLLSTWHKTAIATKNLHQIDAQLEIEQSPFLKVLKDGENRIFTQLPANKRLIALKNSFGFGGTNASICLSNFVR